MGIGVWILGCASLGWLRAAGAEAPADQRSLTDQITETRPAEKKSPAADRQAVSARELEIRVRQLTDSLALANAEAELFRNLYSDLRQRNAILGIEALTADQNSMQEKLVQAVKEAYQSSQDRRRMAEALEGVLKSSRELIQSASELDPSLRAEYEVAVRTATGVLSGSSAGPIPIAGDMHDGQVVHVKEDGSAVIVNVGRQHGVREGTPFFVLRDGRPVGRVKVVLVRDYISAALIELESGKQISDLHVGDRLKVLTSK
jgi:hypothetical protein